MKIAFLGDVHSDLDVIHEFIGSHPYVDAIFQVGDLGIFFSKVTAKKDKDWKRFRSAVEKTLQSKRAFSKPVYFCKGNHEDWDFLGKEVLRRLNVEYVPNGSIIRLGDSNIAVIGGVYSKKRYAYPVAALQDKNRKFFVEEEVQMIGNSDKKIDILVSHIGASGWLPESQKGGVNQLRKLVEKVKPKWYIHGHHHYNYYCEDGEIKIQGLGLLPRSNKSYKIMEI